MLPVRAHIGDKLTVDTSGPVPGTLSTAHSSVMPSMRGSVWAKSSGPAAIGIFAVHLSLDGVGVEDPWYSVTTADPPCSSSQVQTSLQGPLSSCTAIWV